MKSTAAHSSGTEAGRRRPTGSRSASPRRPRSRRAISRNGATLSVARWRGFTRQHANMLSRTVALPVIVGRGGAQGRAAATTRAAPVRERPFAAGTAASFASTLASQALIRVVERDSALWPYAAYRAGLAGVVLAGSGAGLGGGGPSPRGSDTPDTAGEGNGRPAEGNGVPDLGGRLRRRIPLPRGDLRERGRVREGRRQPGGRGRRRRVPGLAPWPRLPADSRQVLASGHYANVVRLDDGTGIALSTDGVGTKLVVAEQLGRWDTVGIDCVAMNVNDVVCVGAEPLAMVDYLAVDRADPEVAGAIGDGLAPRRRARRDRDRRRRAGPARRDHQRPRPGRRLLRRRRAGLPGHRRLDRARATR